MSAHGTVEPVVIQMGGVFDVPAAQEVARAIAAAEPQARLAIDLCQVREFSDFGVAVLAQALARRPAGVSLRGLRQHQLRLLRYLGLDTGEALQHHA